MESMGGWGRRELNPVKEAPIYAPGYIEFLISNTRFKFSTLEQYCALYVNS